MKSLLENYLTLKQAAHVIGMGESTLRRKIAQAERGENQASAVPPWIFFNGRYYFDGTALEKWFRRRIETRAR